MKKGVYYKPRFSFSDFEGFEREDKKIFSFNMKKVLAQKYFEKNNKPISKSENETEWECC